MTKPDSTPVSLKTTRGGRTRSRRKPAAANLESVEEGAASPQEPTEAELLAAVTSLSKDQLRPYGRILRKRLAELAEANGEQTAFSEIDIGKLKDLCSACSTLSVQLEGEADWSATVVDEEYTFIDIYSSKDDYSEEFWAELTAYVEGPGGEEMNYPGGRYVCAQGLVSLKLEFLAAYSLGQVCQIVEIAMTQRKLLGYCNGAIVPYSRSKTMVKEQCAAQNVWCTKAKMPAASWDVLRHALRKMLADSGPEGLPLSNVKRLLRTGFQVDLSETALGHATVSDLFKDARLLDLCEVRLFGNGYFVFPTEACAKAAAAAEADEQKAFQFSLVSLGGQTSGSVPKPRDGTEQGMPQPMPLPFLPPLFDAWGQPFPPPFMFPTPPLFSAMPMLSADGCTDDQADSATWDMISSTLGMADQNPWGGYLGANLQYQGQDSLLQADKTDNTDLEEEGSELSDSPLRIPETGPSSPGKKADGSDDRSTELGSPGSPQFVFDPVSASYDPSSAASTPFPATPFVPLAMTPSPWVQGGGTFSQMLAAASMDCSLSMPTSPADFSVPATPANFYGRTPYPGETPSPKRAGNFANLLHAHADAPATPSVFYGETPWPGDVPSPKRGGTFAHLLRAEARAAGVVLKSNAS